MAEPTTTQPTARTLSIEELVAFVRQGQVRVPEFQRPIRWQWEDARRLVDSVLKGYPIGSLLLWAKPAPRAKVQIGGLAIDAPKRTEAYWVVDGQQRITVLANALSADGASEYALDYDFESGRLVRPKTTEHALPLPVLFDLQRLLKWFAAHPEEAGHLDAATGIAKTLRQYSVPAYIVKQEEEEVLRDIFDRLNNYGRRLTRAEVFTALHSGGKASAPPKNFEQLAEKIASTHGFGLIDGDTVLRALLARRGPDVTRDIRREFAAGAGDFPDETQEAAYAGAEAALSLAVAFLQNDASVPHFGFLPYRYLLVTLTRFFAHHPRPQARNVELLRRWFWRASLAGPWVARGSSTNAMRVFASAIVTDDETASVQNLLATVSAAPPFRFDFPTKYRSTKAEVRFVFAAMWDAGPRSPRTGERFDRRALTSALERRETFTDALEPLFRARGEVSNRVFSLDDDDAVTREDLVEPLQIDASTWSVVLASHGLDEELARSLREGDEERFMKGREEKMRKTTEAFLARMTEARFEDTPPLDALDLDADEGEPRGEP